MSLSGEPPATAKRAGGAEAGPKHKSRAHLLALFFGFAAWAYTYKKDARKLWIAICLNLVATAGLLLAFKSLLDSFSEWLESIGSLDAGPETIVAGNWWLLLAVGLAYLGLWLWPIVDVAKRPADWYEAYEA